MSGSRPEQDRSQQAKECSELREISPSLHRHKKAAEPSQPNVMSSNLILTKSVSYGPFSFDKDGFNIDGILRVGWPSLYEMLFPHEISGIRAQKRARDRAEATITFPWLVAHMTFYEIEFEPEDTVAELTELLADNVKRGTVSRPSAQCMYP